MELADEGGRIDVDDFLGEDGSVVVDADDLHPVLEGLEVELLEEGGFGSLDFFAFGADFEVLGDFDGALVDFGGDVEGVEEVDLGGVEAGGSGGYGEVDGGDDAHACFGGELVGFDFGFEFEDGGVGEDEGDFVFEDGEEDFGALHDSAVLFFEELELFVVEAFGAHADDFLGEGVLVDDEVGVVGPEEFADLLHLVGADVGEVGEDDLLVVPEHFVEAFDGGCLLRSVITHSKILNINNKIFFFNLAVSKRVHVTSSTSPPTNTPFHPSI